MKQSTQKIYFFLALTAILWGGNPVAVKSILGEISPVMIVLLRFVGISIILLAVMFYQQGRAALPPKKHIPTLILMGFTGVGLNNGLQFTGLQYSTAVNCSLVAAISPAVTALLAVAFLQEKMLRRQWLGIAISFLGVVFLIAHGSLEVLQKLSFNRGDMLFLASQISWAVYSVLGRGVMEEMSPMATTAWAGVAGTFFMLMAALYQGSTLTVQLSQYAWVSMAYMIIGSGILAFNWWNAGVSSVGANRTAIFSNVIPLAGMVLSVAFLHEHISWREIVGGLWIVMGVYLTTCQPSSREQQTA